MRPSFVPLAILALLAAPEAQAGMRIDSIDVLKDPVEADLESTLVITLGEVDCASLLLRRPPTETASVQMRSGWTGASLELSGADDHLIDPAPCLAGGSTVPINVTYNAVVLGDVEPLVPQAGTIWWDFDDHPLDDQDPVRAEAQFTLRAKPLLVPQVNFPPQQADMEKEPRAFVITVVNLGNVAFGVAGDATMQVDVRGKTGTPAAVTIVGGEILRDTQGTVTVTADVPPGRWTTARIFGNLTITSVLAGAGDPQPVPFQFMLIHLQPQSKSIPVGPAMPLLAVALAAWAGRRLVA